MASSTLTVFCSRHHPRLQEGPASLTDTVPMKHPCHTRTHAHALSLWLRPLPRPPVSGASQYLFFCDWLASLTYCPPMWCHMTAFPSFLRLSHTPLREDLVLFTVDSWVSPPAGRRERRGCGPGRASTSSGHCFPSLCVCPPGAITWPPTTPQAVSTAAALHGPPAAHGVPGSPRLRHTRHLLFFLRWSWWWL